MRRFDEWLFGKAIRRAERRERKRIIKLIESDNWLYDLEREYVVAIITGEKV